MDTAQRESVPQLTMTNANGVNVAAWVWPGVDPPLRFAHATGFHGRAWYAIARHLPGRRRIAVEIRGYGRSSKPEPPYRWRDFGRDGALGRVVHQEAPQCLEIRRADDRALRNRLPFPAGIRTCRATTASSEFCRAAVIRAGKTREAGRVRSVQVAHGTGTCGALSAGT